MTLYLYYGTIYPQKAVLVKLKKDVPSVILCQVHS